VAKEIIIDFRDSRVVDMSGIEPFFLNFYDGHATEGQRFRPHHPVRPKHSFWVTPQALPGAARHPSGHQESL
jgi:hypothetical protein